MRRFGNIKLALCNLWDGMVIISLVSSDRVFLVRMIGLESPLLLSETPGIWERGERGGGGDVRLHCRR